MDRVQMLLIIRVRRRIVYGAGGWCCFLKIMGYRNRECFSKEIIEAPRKNVECKIEKLGL